MPVAPEERARKRARQALLEGRDFQARGQANRAILEEVRAELQQEVAAGGRNAENRLAFFQQVEPSSSTDHQTAPPEEMQTLAVYAPAQAWALECEARNREYELQCEAEEARRVAADEERARLAPEETRHFRETYERLAAQHAWPALPEGPALPFHISNDLAWFFNVNQPFRAALYAKMRYAMQKEGIKARCFSCRRNVEKLGRAYEPGSWDAACARHKVLSAVHETRIEVALKMEWAGQALMSAVATQQRAAETAERQRLASLARSAEAREERKRHRAVAKQARKELNPRASQCEKCEDADFALGNLCAEHDEELQRIEARLHEESVVLSATEPSDSE
jgi:hypothetical protein